ncbi:hypothetical protein PHYBLDRAFT_160636 [Phycomyces blakesleeanus NRRL 1555(-)]|uniref:Enhancer of mRNA-decapping protein 3 n=1 Tax=Phycomyces blakesleeanus (strain ATCC 8743b / DSM 1359 / FGSC 10004 / NBRC 33097 / NRRL 1555) TaxID=763407 RepID=A0A162N6R1_PHYB8|nr:hypothetical protein PHYBLDRAFT_160636 [Phycomyces blakesleeanus NRRL 1555(-)]OAD66284.1 hypothetical protein PHYBLDRAFT_160636 [Phycomyces blakesleeanus NRRL 1555(-)]|eukprot:XP_018284324.1 hypothetical protein PHYBLDRAFT_160636 [Phycomyces blakesleeanus NRRL 1555(-)]
MAEVFIGLRVSLALHSGVLIDGTVAHIEPSTHQMTLHDVSLMFAGQPALKTPIYGVIGSDIKDLQVISRHEAAPPSTQPPVVTKSTNPHQSRSVETSAPPPKPEVHIEQATEARKKNNEPSQSVSNTPRRTKKSNCRPEKDNGWAEEDVEGFRKKEFDFQANLNMFDKEKVFAEIRESDDTASDTLLVTLNRLPQREKVQQKINLLNTEMVLDPAPSASSYKDSDTDENTSNSQSSDLGEDVNEINASLQKGPPSIVTVNGKIICPKIPRNKLWLIEKTAERGVGPVSSEQLVENGGRSACLLALQAMGNKYVQSSKRVPVAVILVGNNSTGASGLAAARHLLNRGYKVFVNVFISGELHSLLDKQLDMLSAMGAHIMQATALPTQCARADIIVDALMGTSDTAYNTSTYPYPSMSLAIDWANAHSAPIMSLGFPSIINEKPGYPANSIIPKWTLCLGAPITECVSPTVTGELYMADVGIPHACWKQIDVKIGNIPWGAEFLIPLEYKYV